MVKCDKLAQVTGGSEVLEEHLRTLCLNVSLQTHLEAFKNPEDKSERSDLDTDASSLWFPCH